MLLAPGLSAQDLTSWRTSFVIHHPAGYTDTIWIGCDTAATIGFDPGLDVVDTSLEFPITLLVHNPQMAAQLWDNNCGNLRVDIRPFEDEQPMEWYVVMLTDSVHWETPTLTWDSTDYMFQNDSFKLTSVVLRSEEGESDISGAHRKELFLFGNSPLSIYHSRDIAYFYPAWEAICHFPWDQHFSAFRIHVNFNEFDRVAIQEVVPSTFKVNPNPSEGKFRVELPPGEGVVSIISVEGKQVFFKRFDEGHLQEMTIDLPPSVPPGMYFVKMETSVGSTFHKIVLI